MPAPAARAVGIVQIIRRGQAIHPRALPIRVYALPYSVQLPKHYVHVLLDLLGLIDCWLGGKTRANTPPTDIVLSCLTETVCVMSALSSPLPLGVRY